MLRAAFIPTELIILVSNLRGSNRHTYNAFGVDILVVGVGDDLFLSSPLRWSGEKRRTDQTRE